MTRDLSCDGGDRVLLPHIHEFATGRFGRIQVDCNDAADEQVVEKIVSSLRAAGVTAVGRVRGGTASSRRPARSCRSTPH